MTERDASDHRQDQAAHGTDRQCMQRRTGAVQQAEIPQCQAGCRYHQPEHGQVQRPQQRHAPDAAVIPARQPQQMPGGDAEKQHAEPDMLLQRNADGVEHGNQAGTHQQRHVQPEPGLDRFGAAEAALSEEGNHPSADDRHQRRHQP